jgi:pimeloyl-ACP methyl ester carboxylesterase
MVRGLVIIPFGLLVLVLLALFVAYAWAPPEEQDYRSRYLAQIDSRYVDTPVARFHYTKTGDGPPVVLISGGGQWIFSYRDTIPSLAVHFTVYAVDLPGQGYTTVKHRDFRYDFHAMSGALMAFLDAVELRRVALVGHSWGGSWSLFFAEGHPERINKLVLIASPALDLPASWDWRPLEFPIIGELIGKLMRKSDVEQMLRKSFAHQDRVTSEIVDENWAPLSRRENREAMWQFQRRMNYSLTQRHLDSIRFPTLVLWGSEDRFDKPWQAHELGRRIPGAAVCILPECGHSLHEDCPILTNVELGRFLGRKE